MRDILKNPVFYYVLAPIVIGLWPLMVRGVYLPRIQRSLDADVAQYTSAEKCMVDIVALDPSRVLDPPSGNQRPGVFAYFDAISRAADRCQITSHNCEPTIGDKVKLSGKETQEARVKLTDVGITQACTFLYTIQHTWVNLECLKAEIKKKEGAPDRWDVDFNFKYTY